MLVCLCKTELKHISSDEELPDLTEEVLQDLSTNQNPLYKLWEPLLKGGRVS